MPVPALPGANNYASVCCLAAHLAPTSAAAPIKLSRGGVWREAAAAVHVNVSTLTWWRRATAAQHKQQIRSGTFHGAPVAQASPSLSLPPPGCWSCTIRHLGSSRTASNAWTTTRESAHHVVWWQALWEGGQLRSSAETGAATRCSWNSQQQRPLRALQRCCPPPQQLDPCCRAESSKHREWLSGWRHAPSS